MTAPAHVTKGLHVTVCAHIQRSVAFVRVNMCACDHVRAYVHIFFLRVCLHVCRDNNPNRKCAVALVTFRGTSSYLTVLNPVSLSSSLCLTLYCTLTTQAAASNTVYWVHRPSDMNRDYNLLAFPHGGYLIRQKREGWTPERTMDPLRPSMRGESGAVMRGQYWKHWKMLLFAIFYERIDNTLMFVY